MLENGIVYLKKYGQVALAQYLELVPSLVFHPILHIEDLT